MPNRVLMTIICISLVFISPASVWAQPIAPTPTEAMAPVVPLRATGQTASGLPVLAVATDPVDLASFTALIDNEPARFSRALLARVLATPELMPATAAVRPCLFIQLKTGGNHCRSGFALVDASGTADLRHHPFIVLDLLPDRLSQTLIHEQGHLLQRLALAGQPQDEGWTALPHSLFTVSDRVTALSEGYAIHFETLYAHFTADEARRDYYNNAAPRFDGSIEGFGLAPVRDVLTFSQRWQRYQAVRDGLAAFQGYDTGDGYLRTQYDPGRDRARLKTAGQMISSEGVAASFLFWWVTQRAQRLGALPGHGLHQAGLLQAETDLFAALRRTHRAVGSRATLVDLVRVLVQDLPEQSRMTLGIYLGLTRGVTESEVTDVLWQKLYRNSVVLFAAEVGMHLASLSRLVDTLTVEIASNPAMLGRRIGPQIAVRVTGTQLRLPGIVPEPFPLEFDLNACSEIEWRYVPGLTDSERETVIAAWRAGPYASLAAFKTRCGSLAARLPLEPLD